MYDMIPIVLHLATEGTLIDTAQPIQDTENHNNSHYWSWLDTLIPYVLPMLAVESSRDDIISPATNVYPASSHKQHIIKLSQRLLEPAGKTASKLYSYV
jgi:hypothetical protein